MKLVRSLQDLGTRDPGLVAFPRLPSPWRDNLIEIAFLFSRAGSYRQGESSAIYSFCKNDLHTRNREETKQRRNVNKNVTLNHSPPLQRRHFFDRVEPSTLKCVLYEINVKACVLLFLDTSVIA